MIVFSLSFCVSCVYLKYTEKTEGEKRTEAFCCLLDLINETYWVYWLLYFQSPSVF